MVAGLTSAGLFWRQKMRGCDLRGNRQERRPNSCLGTKATKNGSRTRKDWIVGRRRLRYYGSREMAVVLQAARRGVRFLR